ncbi:hypothetical protein GQ55_8G233200 [Panicum hallii var. hallii]|uniref:Disease resistance R13L4/SHOC-2-like LRR domain-containing protein n=1 Tax=Panicum hallii var. hallii TaxID=1504633 RepID=A0A2T7CQF1_9POAL|nr:hypothetical protein GQ55_8G233200 [Panicum hallii var. hallii]
MLQKIQELDISVFYGERSIGALDTWIAPRHIRDLRTVTCCWFSTLPAWVNPSLVPDLTRLYIDVRELHQVDLEILGRLPALRSLVLEVDNKNLGILQGFVVGAGSFPCLARGIASSDGGLDLGLGNLPSLQLVEVNLQYEGANKEAAEKAKAALTLAAEMHPNHPEHDINIYIQI